MKTKFVALLLLVVLACSLASCSFFDKITGIFGGDPEETTTAATTTTTAITDPLRTEPAKVTTAAPQPTNPSDEWSGIVK